MALDKKQVAAKLKEMVVLLELQDENRFKVRAYQNAARTLETLSEDLGTLIAEGKLMEIRGIGSAMAEKITSIYQTGSHPEYDKLRAGIPDGLLELLRIPGLGPRKVKLLWEKLDISTIGSLEYACQENRLLGLEGFGPRSQQKILDGIEMLRKFKDRHRLSDARLAAEELQKTMSNFPGVIRCEIAGSLRRWRETVKDIDILASAAEKDAPAIMQKFVSLPAVETVSARGHTKSSVVLKSGIQADLRVVTDAQFPFALHHFTGSKEHNIALRARAKNLDCKINEYGLFHGDELLACGNEEEIYQKLGLRFIPPELRENLGEIEAAEKGELPHLVQAEDIQGMLHVHSQYSDGVSSIPEMADACRRGGYRYLLICDHSRSSFVAHGLTEERVAEQHREIDRLNAAADNSFRILKGIECDILPDGRLDFSDEILATFDAVVASIHSRFNMTETQATDRIIKAMRNPYVTILGHPTGRLLLARDGYPLNIPAILRAAAELGVAIELNANPHRLDLDWRFCRQAREMGVKISINPDAHRLQGLEDMRYGLGIARKGWLRKEDVLNAGSLQDFRRFAAARRKEAK